MLDATAGFGPGCVKRKENLVPKRLASQNGCYAIFSGSGRVTLPVKFLVLRFYTAWAESGRFDIFLAI